MDWRDLDREIDRLERMAEHARVMPFESLRDFLWGEVWDACEEVQAAFASGIRYPSKVQRDTAWVAFCAQRDRVYTIHRAYRRQISQELYKEIMNLLQRADHPIERELLDHTLFIFDQTTKEDMIYKRQLLDEARALLSENKADMIAEHKQECFKRMQEVRENQEWWWGQRKRHLDARREEQQRIFETKQAAYRQRIEENISKNRMHLERAQSALEKMESSAEDLQGKIESAWNDDWKEKAEAWLEELNSKIESTRERIERLEKWIEDDEEKLREL